MKLGPSVCKCTESINEVVNLLLSVNNNFNLYQNHGHPSTSSTVIQLLWAIWSHDSVNHSHALAVGMIASSKQR